jgi:hypothetical protein
MTYEFTQGLGRVPVPETPEVAAQAAAWFAPPVADPDRPVEPPGAPRYPTLWRGTFEDCKRMGGAVSWGPRAGVVAAREILVAPPSAGMPPPPRAATLKRCYMSGAQRRKNGSEPTTSTSTRSWPVFGMRAVDLEYEQCCYSAPFIAQKQAANDALIAAYRVQLEVYRNSEAYKAYERELRAYHEEREYERARQRRVGALERNRATTTPGDPCSPPGGGITRKMPFGIPRSSVESMEQRLAWLRLRDQGCETEERFFDLEHMEVCCPSGVQVGPAPEEAEKKEYFGFTLKQLGIGALAMAGVAAAVWMIKK